MRNSSDTKFVINTLFTLFTGVSLADVEAVLDQRALKVKRRPGNAKPNKIAAGDCEQQNGEAPVNGKSTKLPSGPNHLDTKSSLKAPGSELKCYSFNNLDTTQLQSLCRRPAILDSPKILSLVKPIIEMVQKSGDKALIELTEKFDKAKLSSPVLEVAAVGEPALESEVQQAIDVSYGNIYRFHKAQLQQEPLVVETCPGVVCSRHVRPIEKVLRMRLFCCSESTLNVFNRDFLIRTLQPSYGVCQCIFADIGQLVLPERLTRDSLVGENLSLQT